MRVLMKFPVQFLFSFRSWSVVIRASKNKMPENAPDTIDDTIAASESGEKYRKKLVKRAEIENMLARHARRRRRPRPATANGGRVRIAVKIVEKIPCAIRRRFRIIQSFPPHTHTHPPPQAPHVNRNMHCSVLSAHCSPTRNDIIEMHAKNKAKIFHANGSYYFSPKIFEFTIFHFVVLFSSLARLFCISFRFVLGGFRVSFYGLVFLRFRPFFGRRRTRMRMNERR